MPSDRFSAQVGLQLSRKPRLEAEPSARPGWAWSVLPVSLLVGIAFLRVIRWLAEGISLAQMFGFGKAAITRLTSAPPRPAGIVSQISGGLIQIGAPLSPELVIGLIFPAILAAGYMVWLIIWSLNQDELEAAQT